MLPHSERGAAFFMGAIQMNRQELNDLIEKRAKLITDAQAELDTINDKSSEADVAEIEKRFDDMFADADKMKARIDREDRALKAVAELEVVKDTRQAGLATVETGETKPDDERKEKLNDAFDHWMRFGFDGMDTEQRDIMSRRRSSDKEMRAQSVGTTTAGGFLVAEDFSHNLEEALLEFGGMREASFNFPTKTGAALPWPTVDETAVAGELVAENAARGSQDVTFGSLTLDAFMYSSKLVNVSLELVQDSDFDIAAFLTTALSDRIGRIQNTHFTTGDGSSKPKGAVVASTLGKTAALNSAITSDELLDLQHSVNSAYRKNSIWMFNDATLGVIRKLKDTNNQPIFNATYAAGAPDQIHGKQYIVNDDMADIATVAKTVLFGDFSKYLIRDVSGITMIRLVERFAELGQVAFLAFKRSDGDLIDAGTAPVKHLIQAV